jgi:hypothetical protein
MDPAPTAPGPRRPARRRHPAARSRVVAGLLSAVLFLGLGAGMAARQTSAATTSASASSASASVQDDTGSSSSGWAATPGSSSSDQSPMTSSQGS